MTTQIANLSPLKEFDGLWTAAAADISRELKTPIASLKGMATALLHCDTWSAHERLEHIRAIVDEAEDIERLMRELLQVKNNVAGRIVVSSQGCRLSNVVEKIRPRLQFLARHHRLEIALHGNLPAVLADPERIAQVVTILVENATRHSSDGISILIEAIARDGCAVVSIAAGAAPGPFPAGDSTKPGACQVDNIAGKRWQRTSLDLPVCQGIIEAHGGGIWVESSLAEGSRFVFTLPLLDSRHG